MVSFLRDRTPARLPNRVRGLLLLPALAPLLALALLSFPGSDVAWAQGTSDTGTPGAGTSKPIVLNPAAKAVAPKPATSKPNSASNPAASRAAVRAAVPLPPPRPASLGGSRIDTARTDGTAPAEPQAGNVQAGNLVARVAPAAASPTEPLSERAGVDLLNAYFNSFNSMTGDFIQVGADGRRYEGKLYIQRPGRMRFEYNAPATIEIIADGTSVAIRDRKLATQDLYTIGQTPLKFLLKERIDLARDTTVKRVTTARDALNVEIEDKATLGGTSRITLQFDRTANVLRQWIIVDPQGYETSVAIFNVETQKRFDQRLFAINYERVLEDRK
jgi:outer membrane lipoprotein-sorting protein